MSALRVIAPLHHPLNHYAVTGGALWRVLVEKFMSVFKCIINDLAY